MKPKMLLLSIVIILCGCAGYRNVPDTHTTSGNEEAITHSLFNDRNATISEENIKKILEGTYKLPASVKVALVRLKPSERSGGWHRYYYIDEAYLKTQQSYIDAITAMLKKTERVSGTISYLNYLCRKHPALLRYARPQ